MTPQIKDRLRNGITMGELLAAAIIIIGVGLSFWKSTDIRLSALEMRMQNSDLNNTNINIKLDKVQDGINDLKLSLKDKQDRK